MPGGGVNAALAQDYAESCSNLDLPESTLMLFSGEAVSSISVPKSTIELETDGDEGPDIQYIVFESVSGKAFFYDSSGLLVNYRGDGDPEEPIDFSLRIDPQGAGKTRILTVDNLSGRIKSIIEE